MESPKALPSSTATRPHLRRLIRLTLLAHEYVGEARMPNYRRALVPGASWFFTVNLLERRGNDLLVRHIDVLRAAVRRVHQLHPFTINAWVVLPEHMHCVWTLPPGEADYSLRWRLTKTFFSRALPLKEYRSAVRLHRGERGIWQHRYWDTPHP